MIRAIPNGGTYRGWLLRVGAAVALTLSASAAACSSSDTDTPTTAATCTASEQPCDGYCIASSLVCCHFGGGTYCPSGTTCGASVSDECVAPQPKCDGACQDDAVGFGLDDTLWLLWNEDIAGTPTGAQDKMVNCPLGGTAHITGTEGIAGGVETIHLTFDLAACASSASSYKLTFTGTVKEDGTFPIDQSGPNAITFTSSSLMISGVVMEDDSPSIDETCPVSLTDTYDHVMGEKGWLNGEVCGRTSSE